MMTTTPTATLPTTPILADGMVRDFAAAVSVCVRPIAQRVTDTITGQVRMVTVPCGST